MTIRNGRHLQEHLQELSYMWWVSLKKEKNYQNSDPTDSYFTQLAILFTISSAH
jgi:hypothetical protein